MVVVVIIAVVFVAAAIAVVPAAVIVLVYLVVVIDFLALSYTVAFFSSGPSPPQNGTIEWSESDRFNSCLSLRWSAGSGVWSHFSIRYEDAGQTERNRTTTAPRAVVCGLAPGSHIQFDIFTVSQNTFSEPLVLEGCTGGYIIVLFSY